MEFPGPTQTTTKIIAGGALVIALLVLVVRNEVIARDSAATPLTRSVLSDDEVVEFFQTTGWLDETDDTWHVPIHGWVYEPQESSVRLALFAKILKERYGLESTQSTAANFRRRINLMVADNERGKTLVVGVATRQIRIPPSLPNGHFRTTVEVPDNAVQGVGSKALLRYTAMTDEDPPRVFEGRVQLVEPEGISVISDIDDTIKVSHVTDHKRLFDYTFFRDFEAVPGMAQLYRHWADSGAVFHFVSSSPWQLYAPLNEFAQAAGFPPSSFHLKDARFRDETFFDLFKEGTETKPTQIEALLDTYPKRKFVLVGDSGEQDPEVYAKILRAHPDQVVQIYIRNVTGAARADERMSAVFDGLPPDCWKLFTDPETLALPPTEAFSANAR